MDSTTTTEIEPSTLPSEIIAGFIGAGVSLGCLLLPILHFVTGPLGPALGGFVAANRVRQSARSRAIVALTVATCLALLVGTALTIVNHVAAPNELPEWFPTSAPKIGALVAVVWAYAAVMATVGTIVRSAVGQKE
jgi:hypothetical protein